ncbi:response regulator [Rhodococcus sp. TAF43]|uniref:response regulator n=1 Tax=unclassified Rhodococcus (in: high G+C Gram-positive bacteria) TaxID=192944 RepID=UPI0015825489|nr:response regulator transcription factor [Rhodococcus sp. W8901]QKT11655.1 response regulator transcription factor [Rhodococcus sp. W8901]
MLTVFLVDDHEVVRRGLAELIDADSEMEVIGQAENRSQALARIPALRPDVVLLDVRLPDGSGIDVCRQLRTRLPELRCLVVTSFRDERAMREATAAGAKGYVVKDIRGMQLVEAVREVGAGRTLLDSRVGRPTPAKVRGDGLPSDLTEQERRLLVLLGEGLTNRQIAARMFLAEKTVKNYVSRLLAKLGVERRTQAAVLATKLQVTDGID